MGESLNEIFLILQRQRSDRSGREYARGLARPTQEKVIARLYSKAGPEGRRRQKGSEE